MTRRPPLTAHGPALRTWLWTWRALAAVHRFETRGLEHLDGPASLVVGYHGRPVAYDMAMLSAVLHRRLGYLPHGVFHAALAAGPLRAWVEGLGCVSGRDPRLAEVVARGEHLMVTPGGTREGYRTLRTTYRVDWGRRLGYLRLAAEHRLPIVPVGASGVDHVYLGLNDGYRLGKRLGVPAGIPVWIGLGPLGPWPLSPGFPVKIRQVIGRPLMAAALGQVSLDDEAGLLRLHDRVTAAVQTCLDRARAPRRHGDAQEEDS